MPNNQKCAVGSPLISVDWFSLDEDDHDASVCQQQTDAHPQTQFLLLLQDRQLHCLLTVPTFSSPPSPSSLRDSSSGFYVRPVPGRGADDPLWFISEPLEHSVLESLLTRVLVVREVYSDRHQHPLLVDEEMTAPDPTVWPLYPGDTPRPKPLSLKTIVLLRKMRTVRRGCVVLAVILLSGGTQLTSCVQK